MPVLSPVLKASLCTGEICPQPFSRPPNNVFHIIILSLGEFFLKKTIQKPWHLCGWMWNTTVYFKLQIKNNIFELNKYVSATLPSDQCDAKVKTSLGWLLRSIVCQIPSCMRELWWRNWSADLSWITGAPAKISSHFVQLYSEHGDVQFKVLCLLLFLNLQT